MLKRLVTLITLLNKNPDMDKDMHDHEATLESQFRRLGALGYTVEEFMKVAILLSSLPVIEE